MIFEKHKLDLGSLPKLCKISGSYCWKVKKPPLIGITLHFKLLDFSRTFGITKPPSRFTSLFVAWIILYYNRCTPRLKVISETHKSYLWILQKICQISGSYCWKIKKPPLIGFSLYFNYQFFQAIGITESPLRFTCLLVVWSMLY